MADTKPGAAAGPCAVYISGNIGDSVLHMGLVRALSEHLGRPLILLNPLPPALNRLFETQPWIERVLSIGEIERDADHGRRRREMTELLRSLQLDTLFFFNFKTYAAIAARLAGVPRRVGFVRRHQFHNALLFSHHVMVQKRGTPHPDTHTWLPRLLARHGYPAEAIYPSLLPSEEAAARAALLAQHHPHLIGLGLNASAPVRRYSGEQFVEVIKLLLQDDPRRSFLLFGVDDVADIAADIRQRLGDGARLLDITTTKPDLPLSFALVARCEGFISNDSAGLHLAVAHRIATVGLFGASPPMRYAPWLRPLQATGPGGMAGIEPRTIVQPLLAEMAHLAAAPAAA